MGQMVAVTEQPSTSQGIVRFELNRALTGMGHEYFRSDADAVGPRPAAELARRLFATEQVDTVHVYSNIVTVTLTRGGRSDPLADVVGKLYRYWQPGMEPPTFDDPAPAEDAAPAGDGGDGDGDADPALAAAMAAVPAHLLERSKAGRERWNAGS